MAADTNPTFDIILLFGPDVGNKFDYLSSSLLSGNVEIICPDDLYRENSDYGLRDIALRIVDALKQQKQVVVNDELNSALTRESLLATVRKKVPTCRVLMVQVIPKYGFLQAMWSQQHLYATGSDKRHFKDEDHLRKWFDESMQNIDHSSGFVDKPSENEGYSIKTLFIPLQITSNFKFEFPALFFQWEAVLNENEEISSPVEMLCAHWVIQNPCGRIFFINEKSNETKDILQSNESSIFVRCLKQFVLIIKHPVYYIKTNKTLSPASFCTPPQPGILAFLHSHHLLNLQSKSTCYIFGDVNHMRMAEAAGVRHFKISALKSPDVVIKGQSSTSTVPRLLKTMNMKKPNAQYGSVSPKVTVPLFDHINKMIDGHVSQTFENGLIEDAFVKDIQSFCLYQEECAHQATPIDQPGSKLKVVKGAELNQNTNKEGVTSGNTKSLNRKVVSEINIPHWMKRREVRLDSEDETCSTNQHGKTCLSSIKSINRSAQTVYVMSEKEALDMARQILLQANHEDIIKPDNKSELD